MAEFDKDDIPEQLDDLDFEKEKSENKRLKKMKSISDDEEIKGSFMKKHKTAVTNSIAIAILILLIAFVAFYIYNKNNSTGSKAEECIKDFCAFFNSRNWDEVNSKIDLKGYYVLAGVLEEKDYTKFDKAYSELKNSDKDYSQFSMLMKEWMNIDSDILKSYSGDSRITVNQIENSVKIQNTKNLYKIRVNFRISSRRRCTRYDRFCLCSEVWR